ncbi:YciI family protein [Nonomuraea candida]|uniref:YciI family protein n=1 Tax=Nonomuraea candida TaxID=359159 RepID=UPI0005BB673B|nr:YciI family protein [Nonomuraea candida]
MAKYVVHLAFDGDPRRLAARPAHREHLRRLKERGLLVTAGPWADDSGAVHVYEVADEAELRGILREDPYTAVDGCEIVLLKEWTPIM